MPPHQADRDQPDPQKVLEDLQRATLALGIRSTWEIANRRGLLWAHALWSIFIGVNIVIYGGPGNIERTFGLWTRPALGLMGLLGAVLLAAGLYARPRNVGREIAGLVVLGLWDLAMAGGILASRVEQGDFTPRLWGPQPLGYVTGYAVGVYGLLGTLVVIHLWTLTRLSPGRLRRGLRKAAAWTRLPR